jgi:hypothetical protein
LILASPAHIATWLIADLAIVGVLARPWNLPQALWPRIGAAALAVSALITIPDAWTAVRKGTDVYLFLTGMLLLAELARHEGLFDWLAAHAVHHSKGSPRRLFGLVYLVGTMVTVFLSNDATAVVLTPAVYAAARQANAKPLPYLLICAFIANAASFVLPISNPANLVVYGARCRRSARGGSNLASPRLSRLQSRSSHCDSCSVATWQGKARAPSAYPICLGVDALSRLSPWAIVKDLLERASMGRRAFHPGRSSCPGPP